ncbi:MAG: 23S rRNA pseudouridine(1911/1915/1917) synthase RluD [Methyloprofundus sp.]|nr:23S rRNA pseudouridine(1911/1915/1917) synthase RluD [Methyloprofundus sp.]
MAILIAEVPLKLAGKRLDQVLVALFPDYSRNKLQTWIKAERVTVDGRQLKAKDRLEGAEHLELDAEAEEVTEYLAEDIPLDIIYEDEDILIVNKPAGLVVHPGAGNWTGTLQNGLLFYLPDAATVPRSGIVHRIDKDTSGLLMVAKTLAAHHSLVEQLQARTIHREYLAITIGRMTGGGTLDEPIGRHPTDRKKYAVRDAGKPAITHYRVLERFLRNTLIQVKLETGRTHQIRVHMAHLRMPLVGDPMYSGRFQMPKDCGQELETVLRSFKRQALHAEKLGLIHPRTGEYMQWELPVPDDMQQLLAILRANDSLDHG